MAAAKMNEKPIPGANPGELRGWAFAKGLNVGSRWKDCFLVVQDGALASYKDDTLSGGVLNIPLNGWMVKELERKELMKHCESGLRLSAKGRIGDSLCLSFGTAENTAAWHDAIQYAVAVASPAVFGIPLVVAVAKGGAGNKRCPFVLRRLIAFLEKANALSLNGLFRISAAQSEVVKLRDAFNDGSEDKVEQVLSEVTDFHVVSHLIKLFLRELPEPLVPRDRYMAFIEAAGNVQRTAEAVATLPKEHQHTLQFLIKFLTKVASRSAENLMTSRNLAVVFGPTILRMDLDPSTVVLHSEPISLACETMINNYDPIFQAVEREAADTDGSDGQDGLGPPPATAAPQPKRPGGLPMPFIPTVVPGSVKLKPVGVDPMRKTPRGTEEDGGGTGALGPHMLKKAEVDGRPTPPSKPAGIEGRPTPGSKPLPRPVPGAAILTNPPQRSVPLPSPGSVTPREAMPATPKEPPAPPVNRRPSPPPAAATQSLPPPQPVGKEGQRRSGTIPKPSTEDTAPTPSVQPPQLQHGGVPGKRKSETLPKIQTDEVDIMRQVGELTATVQNLQEMIDRNSGRIKALESSMATQDLVVKQQQETLESLYKAAEEMQKKLAREKSGRKIHRSAKGRSKDPADPSQTEVTRDGEDGVPPSTSPALADEDPEGDVEQPQ